MPALYIVPKSTGILPRAPCLFPTSPTTLAPRRAPRPRDAISSHDLDTPRDSAYGDASVRSASLEKPLVGAAADEAGAMPRAARPSATRKALWALGGSAVLASVLLAVLLPLHFTGRLGARDRAAGAASTPRSGDVPGGAGPASPEAPTSGGNGTVVALDSGEDVVYINPFGGAWAFDPEDPYGSAGRANAWTPGLNETWTWGEDRVFGVNLGGLFVLEPFIVPALFQKYPGAVDEWTLYSSMREQGTLEEEMEDHYNTFITEKDIMEIAAAGLNFIRLPIPFWAIPGSVWDGEPFPEGLCWKYILRIVAWARKYGLRVNLDLHTVPGSQNGYNHSGRLGQVNFLHGPMGLANAQRFLSHVRAFAAHFAQPAYRGVVAMFGIVNEPLLAQIGRGALDSFYSEAYRMVREITGTGAGQGPYLVIGDGFGGLQTWAGTFEGADRLVLDQHPYMAFDGGANDDPIATGTDPTDAGGKWPLEACNRWGAGMNASNAAFGVTVAGEFSCGYNDCGLYVRGVGNGAMYGGDCGLFEDASAWNATMKAGLKTFIMASMDALNDWFFWTWKIGPSAAGRVEAPLWSYQLGLQEGYIPKDPRAARGLCAAVGADRQDFDGSYAPWATGGAGAGELATAYPWPPATINAVGGAQAAATALPTYAATGAVPTLTASATFSGARGVGGEVSATGDSAPAVTPVAGCTYPDPWDALDAPLPATTCA
ncbi:glycoside hydrolase family 5 protein [Schizophyllum fasciatum]